MLYACFIEMTHKTLKNMATCQHLLLEVDMMDNQEFRDKFQSIQLLWTMKVLLKGKRNDLTLELLRIFLASRGKGVISFGHGKQEARVSFWTPSVSSYRLVLNDRKNKDEHLRLSFPPDKTLNIATSWMGLETLCSFRLANSKDMLYPTHSCIHEIQWQLEDRVAYEQESRTSMKKYPHLHAQSNSFII